VSHRVSPERVQPLSDDAWLVELGDAIDERSNAEAHALAAAIRAAAPPWLRDLVPAYASLGVFFDARSIAALAVRDWLMEMWATLGAAGVADDGARIVDIAVLYGGEAGPDLASAAVELGLTPEALVQRHAAPLYRVAMIGFAPGFPYLSGLDPALALPRLATPRTHVPAGTVAIGGAQTGIYPRESPGGWRLIGRTPTALFDPLRDPPSLLAPGDRVRFRAISAAEAARLQQDR
jgi:KipI family sensor histidine kinase inhibitor